MTFDEWWAVNGDGSGIGWASHMAQAQAGWDAATKQGEAERDRLREMVAGLHEEVDNRDVYNKALRAEKAELVEALGQIAVYAEQSLLGCYRGPEVLKIARAAIAKEGKP